MRKPWEESDECGTVVFATVRTVSEPLHYDSNDTTATATTVW